MLHVLCHICKMELSSRLPPCIDAEIIQVVSIELVAGFALIGPDHLAVCRLRICDNKYGLDFRMLSELFFKFRVEDFINQHCHFVFGKDKHIWQFFTL